MPQIIDAKHLQQAQQFRQMYSTYRQNQDLISLGAYSRGSDPNIDEAIAMFPALQALLRQGMQEGVNWQTSMGNMSKVMAMRQQVKDAGQQAVRTPPATLELGRR
jgi:flagellum-specific ATP synthase